jgi:hypothetical protein
MSILNVPLPESDAEILTQMVERQTDLHALLQKVRLCRLKLGAVLNRLEMDKLNPDELKLMEERTDEVSNDIRILVETIQWLMDR